MNLLWFITTSLFFVLFVFPSYLHSADAKSVNTTLFKKISSASVEGKKLNHLIKEQKKNHQQAAQSQHKVSALAHETRDLVKEYRDVLRQIADERARNAQLRKLIKDQEQENSFIRQQIAEVKKTRKEILPLMLEMYGVLEKFIQLDMPFLIKERKNRLMEMKAIMNRADVTLSEKYRRLMEAYGIENEYGKTLEAYHGMQNINGQEIDVNYLRVGRIALIYQTRDGGHQAYWDNSKKEWVSLPSKWRRAIKIGLQVARKQQAPELLVVPIPSPVRKGSIML